MKDYFSARTEQRQHINLSKHAYGIIEEDSFSFWGKTNISGMINAIYHGFAETSMASISIASRVYREKMIETIKAEKGSKNLSDVAIETVECCTKGYIKELQNRTKDATKDKTLKIRLQNDIYDDLYPENGSSWAEAEYYASPSQYLKALCEDYAAQTYFEREAIIFKENLDNLQLYIDNNEKRPILTISYVSARGNHYKYDVKPLRISTAVEAEYHYLICLSKKVGSDNSEYAPASFRVSRIAGITPHALSAGSGKLTAKQQKELNEAVAKNGVAFLFTSSKSYVVKLTAKGIQDYNQLTHLRPIATKKEFCKDGSGIFTFDCTEAQIEYYFFSFGKEAKVISHPELREKMRQKFLEAYECYSEKDQ